MQINIKPPNGVKYVEIKGIHPAGRADVYNMEVEGYHNYSVNGGYIIHNCDALRYYCYTKLPSWRIGMEKENEEEA